MIDELADAAVERCPDRDVVEHRHVLGVLAEPDPAGVRAHRDAELRREQHDREHLVHTAEPAAVELDGVDRTQLQQLLEDDPVRVVGGRYLAPTRPGYSIEIRPESLSEFVFPDGPVWWQEQQVTA